MPHILQPLIGYRPRWIEHALAGRTSQGKVRLLFGARQTGKSWLFRRLTPPGTLRIDLQDGRERARYERDPGAFTSEILARKERRLTIVVDEIQKVPALLEEVQLLVDRHPRRFEIFLTGSSARRLRAGSANLLPGRAHTYRMFPIVSAEREGFERSEVLPLGVPPGPGPRFANEPIERRLVWGSLPGVVGEPAARATATLEAYAENYVEEEVRRESLVRDVGAFGRFLEIAAMESGRVMNLTGLSQESGVPVATLRTYYQVLVDTFLGHWIGSYGPRGRKQLLTTPRFVFFDTGVRNAAARLPLSRDLLKTQAGTLFEQWVLLELVHRAAYLGRSHRVSFWRTRHGAEVDAVVETPKIDVPIEVKWTESPRPADARHVEAFLDTYPTRARAGLLVCRVRRPMRLTDRVTAIPWSDL